ncbi:hypothetical protein KCU62_g165, partial [Aureobasidium sp. EXF-3399]
MTFGPESPLLCLPILPFASGNTATLSRTQQDGDTALCVGKSSRAWGNDTPLTHAKNPRAKPQISYAPKGVTVVVCAQACRGACSCVLLTIQSLVLAHVVGGRARLNHRIYVSKSGFSTDPSLAVLRRCLKTARS